MDEMATDVDTIYRFLQSDDWTESEKWVIKWQYNKSLNLLGGFETALAEAICQADENNLALLYRGFPDQVTGYTQWTRGGLGRRLRAAGLNI